MNEIIQSLEADVTNGDNNFCMINEKMLLAIKELSKRDYQEKLELQEENKKLKEEKQELKKKYKKSLELLTEYNLPCEIDNFNTKEENLEYCFKNCSVDEIIYIKCWNRFIEQELEKE